MTIYGHAYHNKADNGNALRKKEFLFCAGEMEGALNVEEVFDHLVAGFDVELSGGEDGDAFDGFVRDHFFGGFREASFQYYLTRVTKIFSIKRVGEGEMCR